MLRGSGLKGSGVQGLRVSHLSDCLSGDRDLQPMIFGINGLAGMVATSLHDDCSILHSDYLCIAATIGSEYTY